MPEPSKRALARYLAKHSSASDAAARLYVALMEEVKVRLRAIDSGTLGLLYNIPPTAVQEFCFLQLRMCCELVALGCLVAHGDIDAQTRLEGDYQADKILNALERLDPEFFPVAREAKRADAGFIHMETIQGRLTKPELVNLYRECGSRLHKGSLKNLLSDRTPKQVRYPQITRHAQSLVDLLSFHSLKSFDGRLMFICSLFPANGGMAEVATAETMLDGPPQQA